jgi:enoyl-CoA hydratase/carnithine racemase
MTDVLVDTTGAVTTIRLNRPAKRNAVTMQMYTLLADALAKAGADPSVRVVVLTGSGGSFTAGNDLADMRGTTELGPDSPPRRFLDALVELPHVLLIGVAGPAIGIGTTVLLHADLVIATRASVFAMPFVSLGLIPEAASTFLLPELVGRARAASMTLLGERIDADRAEAWGLINRVIDGDQDDLDEHLAQAAALLAALPGAGLAQTRRLLRAHTAEPVRARLDEDGHLMQELMSDQFGRS